MNINDLQLNHQLTPEPLRNLNTQIMKCLCEPDGEDATSGYPQLRALVVERDELIHSLQTTLDANSAREFAKLEQVANSQLLEVAQSLLESAKDDVSQFIRSQAAVNKYK